MDLLLVVIFFNSRVECLAYVVMILELTILCCNLRVASVLTPLKR
jgi:hypothetical protein